MLEKFDLLAADYIDTGQVKFVVYPFYLGNPEVGLITEAAWCANDQGKFFEFEHAAYQNQGQFPVNRGTLADLAASVGVEDMDAFSACLADGTHRNTIEQGRQTAAARGVNSTPTFFINNQRVEGNQPYQNFQQVIEQELSIAQ